MSEPVGVYNSETLDNKEKAKQEIINVVFQVRAKKEDIIKMKLKEIGKLNLLKNYAAKRFKPLLIVTTDTEEIVYIDNKTIGGKRLVTFLKHNETELNDEELKLQIKYY